MKRKIRYIEFHRCEARRLNNDFFHQAKVMKAFCDENRLKILARLRGGETCACNLLSRLEIGQPALSYHMKVLVESGVVESRESGKWTHYRLSERGSEQALDLLRAILSPEGQEASACGGTMEGRAG
jgi:ArsR family transcriptional regulator, arsenate/arsenite/antimonite-responsive transcriptional repressor